MKPVGSRTVADARKDGVAIRNIGAITELPESTVAERLQSAKGATHVRNALGSEWPWTAARLGPMRASFARDHGLHLEIRWLTNATPTLVSRRLNGHHGGRLVKNLFWDCWPEEKVAPPWMEETGLGRLEALQREPEADVPESIDGDVRDDRGSPTSEQKPEVTTGALLSSRYELRNMLGRGGFGTTYAARDRLAEMDVVVKLPHEEDGEAIRRELRQAFRVVHPNICRAFPERDDETGRPFLVMQHGGEDLGHRLERTKEPFAVGLAVHVLSCIADALDYLHEQLVVHLDVSPGNILIDEDDCVRLTDFGSSAHGRERVTADGDRTIVATSVLSLNPHYAAPEMHHGEARSRSDQYSLALVVCSLLEGRVLRDRYRFRGLEALSDSQNAAMSKALSQHPEDRFDSCGELARAVADEMAHVPETVLAKDLDRFSRSLLGRFTREIDRQHGGTARVGGVVLLGRAIERFLQATLLWMSAVDGFDPEAELRQLDPKATSLARATLGRIARLITNHSGGEAAQRPEVAPIVADLAGGSSRLWKLIDLRNKVVHGTGAPESILPAAGEFAALLREHRRAAGWSDG